MLPNILQSETLGLPIRVVEELDVMLELYQLYVRGFYYCTAACYLTRLAQQTCKKTDRKNAEDMLGELTRYRDRVEQRMRRTDYPHYVYWLLDVDRLQKLSSDVKKNIENI